MDIRSPAEVSLLVSFDKSDPVKLSLNDILSMIECGGRGDPDAVALVLSQDGAALHAQAPIGEREYPGISVDCVDANGERLYQTGTELPNQDYPDRVVSRLYAGYAAYETDEPIACVSSKLLGEAGLDKAAESSNKKHTPTKIVYIDTSLAASRPWPGSQDGKPEHLEDEN